jgi:Leucine-rich repeat (LRR) protein
MLKTLAQRMKYMKKGWLIALITIANISVAQQFTELTGTNFPSLSDSRSAFADFDNDGDLDLIMVGDNGTSYVTTIYRNDAGVFTDMNLSIQSTILNVSVADWDNDNDIDLLIGGDILYRNDGNFVFVSSGTITKADQQSIWADYDADGDLDVLNVGWIGTGSHLLRNDNGVFVDTNLDLAPGYSGDWADFDADGDLDFVIGGYLAATDYNGAIIYEQLADSFRVVQGSKVNALKQVYNPQVKWVNTDSDKFMELLVTGTPVSDAKKIMLYDRPTTNFFEVTNAFGINMLNAPSFISTADCDNDGDVDIAIGNYGIFDNNNNGAFTVIDSIRFAHPIFADIDNDGDVDLLSTDAFSDALGNFITEGQIHVNQTSVVNNRPNSPNNLSSFINGNSAIFNWSNASDDNTSVSGLTYNYYVKDYQENIIAISQTDDADQLMIAQKGLITKSGNFSIKNLPEGSYRWSIQAIDGAFKSSNFATEKGFHIGQIVYVPDTILLDTLIKLGVDNNYDSLISYQEAASFAELDISGRNIKDATGIEAFVNLLHLNVSNNPITTLNINTLDKLQTLTADSCNLNSIIFANGNILNSVSIKNNNFSDLSIKRLEQCITIDISGNPLVSFTPEGASSLLTLTVNNCVNLSTLGLSNNLLLKNLTVTNSNLLELTIAANDRLKTINLSNNSILGDVCVWVYPFPPGGVTTNTTNSPSLQFSPCLDEVYVPDDNFRQGLILNGADGNNDGFITYTESLDITELYVSYRNIQDLTGLQAFKNLTTFIAEGNQISSFSVDSIPLLSNINVRANNMNDITMSKYKALVQVDISDNNISELDLSENNAIAYLKINKNNLTALNLDSLAELMELDLSDNLVDELSLENNKQLRVLQLANNAVETLNLNQQQELTILSVDSCESLYDLKIRANFKLGILLAGNTNLSFLDLRNNTNLSRLSLGQNANLTNACVWGLPFPTLGITYTYNTFYNTEFSLCDQDENSWSETYSLPTNGVRFTTGFVINDTAYVGTGFTDQYEASYWAFDSNTEVWEQKADFPGRLEGFGKGFGVNNNGYVMTHDDVLGAFWKYESSTNTWTSLNMAVTGGHSYVAGFVANDAIYVHGGEKNAVKSSAFWKFDPLTESWSQMAQGPQARTHGFGFARDTVGFIGGGLDDSNQTLSDFWRYNVPSNTWEQMDDLMEGRKEAISVSHQGRLFYGGGLNPNDNAKNDWIEYLPVSDTMVVRANLPGPNRSGAIALSAGNAIYFGTGYNGAVNYNDWWKYMTNELVDISTIKKELSISLFPNPATEFIHIENLSNKASLKVMSLNGQTIWQENIQNGKWNVPEQMVTGIYLLQIINNETISTHKVIIQR